MRLRVQPSSLLSIAATALLALVVTASGPALAEEYVLLLNGGDTFERNHLRYLENLRAIYAGYRARGYRPEQFTVLYADGSFASTHVAADARNKTIRLDAEYVFRGESVPVGASTAESVDATLEAFAKKLKPGDVLHFFITDHGSSRLNGSIQLWNRGRYSVDRLAEKLGGFVDGTRVLVTTNICYGGAFARIGSSKACVAATQIPEIENRSQGASMNVFAQAYGDGLAFGKSGTFGEAFEEAKHWDVPENHAWTSIDELHERHRREIDAAKGEPLRRKEMDFQKGLPACVCGPLAAVEGLANCEAALMRKMLQDLDVLDLASIPAANRDLLAGRLAREGEELATLLKTQKRDTEALYRELGRLRQKQLELGWARASGANELRWDLRAEELKMGIGTFRNKLQNLPSVTSAAFAWRLDRLSRYRKEIDILKYGSPELVAQYRAIRACYDTPIGKR